MPRGITRAGSRPGYWPGFFLLMEDGSHAQIMLCRTKDIFHFRKLDVGIPQDFRIGFIPVGAQDIAAAHVPSPCITFLVLVYAAILPPLALKGICMAIRSGDDGIVRLCGAEGHRGRGRVCRR